VIEIVDQGDGNNFTPLCSFENEIQNEGFLIAQNKLQKIKAIPDETCKAASQLDSNLTICIRNNDRRLEMKLGMFIMFFFV
jgi:hypothetical protein